jgi:hypothetical protein
LARAREILGLPPAPPTDPLHEERQNLEAARQELTSALDRTTRLLNENPGARKPKGSDTPAVPK